MSSAINVCITITLMLVRYYTPERECFFYVTDIGRLGNQMFEYVTLHAMTAKYHEQACITEVFIKISNAMFEYYIN